MSVEIRRGLLNRKFINIDNAFSRLSKFYPHSMNNELFPLCGYHDIHTSKLII